MRLLELTVKNVRGVTASHIDLGGRNVVIWGPNGVGKSSIVDAIDFLFTGKISRLMGAGTAGITLARHGPHIDRDLDTAAVTATIELEEFPEPLEISRTMGRRERLDCPDEARGILRDIGTVVESGGVILTRRDILRFVTGEASKRADDIQALLNLKEMDNIRSGLVSARTQLARADNAAKQAVRTAEAEVNVTLGKSSYSRENLLKIVNECRRKLGADPIDEPNSVDLKGGILAPIARTTEDPGRNRVLFQKLVQSIAEHSDPDLIARLARSDEELRAQVADLKSKPSLVAELEQLELTTSAMRFVDIDTVECPVCGAGWPQGHLRTHLEGKKAAAASAERARTKISKSADSIAEPARNLRAFVKSLRDTLLSTKTLESLEQHLGTLDTWLVNFDRLLDSLQAPVEFYPASGFTTSVVRSLFAPTNVNILLEEILDAITAELPETTPEQTAWDTLTRLEERVRSLESRAREGELASLYLSRSEKLLQAYESARNSELKDLYSRIAGRFGELYRTLHDHEGENFGARLNAAGAGLNFEVDFLGRGSHPPLALHSEGHQDSMGICLFLALYEELAKGVLRLVVLDDVVMSVDAGHRRELSRLLKSEFSECQFIITTHDKTWAQQLKQGQIVDGAHLLEFTRWSVETGPQAHQQLDIWEAMKSHLDRENVPEAAFTLRRGSEGFFESVCDNLGAGVTYNSRLQWQLDDWLPAAMDEYSTLVKRARRAALSWGKQGVVEALDEAESVRKQVYGRTFAEQWAINNNVHYNNWANMSGEEFSAVAEAFQDLHGLFTCSFCGGLLEKLPRKGTPRTLKCPCGEMNWNLQLK